MPLTDVLETLPEQLLGVVAAAQDAVISTVTSVAETVKPVTPDLSSTPLADLGDPKAAVDGAFAFAEKLLASQRAFTARLFEAYGA